jgi:hypothetical protein
MKRITFSLFFATGLFMTGCWGNLATFQPARTMPAGGFAVGVEGSGIGVFSDAGDKQEGTLSIAGRYAVTDRIEIGARVGSVRPEIMAKFRLDQGKPGKTAISLAPSVGAFVATATGIVGVNSYGQLPILVGIPVGRHEFVFSGALHFAHAVNVDTNVWGFALGPGASVGFVAQPLPWLSILPNLALAMPLLHAGPTGPGTSDTLAYQLGLAIIAGKLH